MNEENKKRKMGRKSTEASYEERIPESMEMILYQKLSYSEFKETAARKFGITSRAAENLWSDIKNRIKERFKEEQEEIITQQLQRTFDLLERCREAGNRRVEAEVLRDLSKLYGLDVKRVDVTSSNEKISININLAE
jgi:gas vesicle protein